MDKNNDSSHVCSPSEAALKSLFLGPQSENSDWLRLQVLSVLDHWFQWRKDLHPSDGKAISRDNQKSSEFMLKQLKMQDMLKELCHRFENEIPQFSPRYIGHMYSEISLPALLGHFVALLHNPNNISTEAARVGAFIEDEAIQELSAMLGFDPQKATGHFTSGGTVANIEGLWRARYRLDHFLSLGAYLNLNHGKQLSYVESAHIGWKKYYTYLADHKIDEKILRAYSAVAMGPWKAFDIYKKAFGKNYEGPIVLVPNSKHYSWLKAVSLLGLGDVAFQAVDLNEQGVMDLASLKDICERAVQEDRPIMMLVSVAGTTELGECDPIDQVQDYLDELHLTQGLQIWHHVDAAYGGYFCSMKNFSDSELPSLKEDIHKAFTAIARVDSVTLDPHKLGYVPYACGAIIVPDELRYRVSAFDAKYIQSPNENIDRWMKTLEGSRSAAGATATWMTAKTIGLHAEGYGRILARTVLARTTLAELIQQQCPELAILDATHLNLLCLANKGNCRRLSEMNQRTEALIDKMNQDGGFVVSKTSLKRPEYQRLIQHHCKMWGLEMDDSQLVLLRMTLMNPFFTTKETAVSFPEELIKSLRLHL